MNDRNARRFALHARSIKHGERYIKQRALFIKVRDCRPDLA
jgi:hypothetical protein